MKWNSFKYQQTNYDLSHLDSFEWYCTIDEKNNPEIIYKFHVSFSMHCFTRKALKNEGVHKNKWYQGEKEKRVFCFDRYELSKQLPNIIQDLKNRQCWHTHHGNFFTIEVTDKDGQKVDYEIYFDVNRARRKGWLHLVVQSAYTRTNNYRSTQPRKRKIRFKVIAYKKQNKKSISPGQ